jgi:hypothetical protein
MKTKISLLTGLIATSSLLAGCVHILNQPQGKALSVTERGLGLEVSCAAQSQSPDGKFDFDELAPPLVLVLIQINRPARRRRVVGKIQYAASHQKTPEFSVLQRPHPPSKPPSTTAPVPPARTPPVFPPPPSTPLQMRRYRATTRVPTAPDPAWPVKFYLPGTPPYWPAMPPHLAQRNRPSARTTIAPAAHPPSPPTTTSRHPTDCAPRSCRFSRAFERLPKHLVRFHNPTLSIDDDLNCRPRTTPEPQPPQE